MADIVKLKKKAADFEAKKQMDKALEVYVEIVEAYEAGDEDTIDIPLYNRVGDLFQKVGKVAEAVEVWEKAVDRYAEGGFYNPAIALCNKILRQSPGRTVIYYKLGKIHAEKGFKGDARQNFLEYASRQQKSGNLNEAFRALKEFADLVPDQHDVRIMLADQLAKAGRKDEAVGQLQLGYSQATADGSTDAAQQIVAKLKEIDPTVKPEATESASSSGGGGLVFLDVDDHAAPKRPSARTSVAAVKRVTNAVKGLELLDPVPDLALPPKLAPKATPAVASAAPAAPPLAPPPPPPAAEPETAASDLVIESTDIGAGAPPPPRGSVVGLEVTNFGDAPALDDAPPKEPAAQAPVESLLDPVDEPQAASSSTAPATNDLPMLDIEPTASVDLPLIDLDPVADDAQEPVAESVASPVAERVAEPVDEPETSPVVNTAAEPVADVEIEPLAEVGDQASADVELIESEPPISLDSTEFGDAPSFGDSGSLEIVHSSDVSAPMFDVPDTAADLPLLDIDDSESVEPPTVPSAETIALRASQALPVMDLDDEIEVVEVAVPSSAPKSVAELRETVSAMPEDWSARRQLAEALLEAGERAEAMAELERAMAGFESVGDLDTAGSVAEEIVRLDPKSIRSHKKRVEFAFRANDRAKLAEAYLELADALVGDGQAQQARTVYLRVLDITPDDIRAQAAIESIPLEAEPVSAPAPRRSTSAAPPKAAKPVAPAAAAAPVAKKDEDDFVSLGDWLREDDEPKSTRMVVEEKEPTGDEAADFSDMLRAFKQGVAENVDDEDHEAHYDLGVAYKEMGLVDEAIAEFQKALRGTTNRARTFEALGNCFIEKQQLPVAATIMQRALNEPGIGDESLVGVLYLLGAIAEEQGQFADAKKYYQRVFAVDIQFRDIGDRLNVVEQQLS